MTLRKEVFRCMAAYDLLFSRFTRFRPYLGAKGAGMRTRLLTFAAIACHGAFAQPIISTIAGMGAPPSGIPATSVSIGSPSRIARDAAGNVYFAAFHCVYKVDPAGILTRVAGTGSPGYGGDGGPATDALLNFPSGVHVAGQGRLYIADNSNSRVRRVDASGTIATVAGNGIAGYSGDGGPATQAQLDGVRDVVADSQGNIYIAEEGRVRRVATSGIISTAAGTGSSGNYIEGGPATQSSVFPIAVAVDAADNLYLLGDWAIHRVDASGRIFQVRDVVVPFEPDWLDQGTRGTDIAVDAVGTVYLANTSSGLVRRIPPGGQGSTAVRLPSPVGVAIDPAGNLFVATSRENRIWKVDPAGSAVGIAGNGSRSFSGDGGPAVNAQLDSPSDIAVDTSGNVYIADTDNHRIRKIDTAGRITTVAGDGTADFGGDGGPATAAWLKWPGGVAVDGTGNVFIADTGNSRIRKVDAGGQITTVANVAQPRGMEVSAAGDLYLADAFACRVHKVDAAGQMSNVVDLPGCRTPRYYDLAVDGQGNIYVADYRTMVQKVSAGGQVTRFAGGSGGFNDDGGPATAARLANPSGVAAGNGGNVYISEHGIHTVRRVAADGRLTTVAGNRLPGFSGDGGPAVAAQLLHPAGLATDGAGDLYVTETALGRIRKVSNPAAPAPGLTIATSQSLTVLVDGVPVNHTQVWAWPVGSQHLLDVPTPQFTDGDTRRYRFSHWSQGGPKTQTITMPEEQATYRAHFFLDLAVRVTTLGRGTVTLDPPLPADGYYPHGTVVTMRATPDPGWLFQGFRVRGALTGANPWTDTLFSPIDVTGEFVPQDSAASGPLRFVAVTPCRVMDTRPGEGKTGPFGAPALEGGQTRTVPIPQSTCGIPGNAAAYSLNATVVPSGPLGFLTLWPAGQNQPQVSTLNSFEGRVVANAAIVPAGPGGAINVFVTDETHVILDINGYFVP
jgi:sugar lactone lactonase YvrE